MPQVIFRPGDTIADAPGNDAAEEMDGVMASPFRAAAGSDPPRRQTAPSDPEFDDPLGGVKLSVPDEITTHAGPRQLRRLLDAVMAVGTDVDLPTVLRNVVVAARDLVGARYAALGVLDVTRTHLSEFITVGLDEGQRAAIGEPPKGHGLLGVLITDPRPMRLPDLGEHPESFGFPPNHPPMKSFLGVPIRVRGEVYGNLYLTDKEHDDGFSDIDEELVLGLAAAAALIIDNARLQEQAAELLILADRDRIGRGLHDTVIQHLFATGLAMQGTLRLADRPEMITRLNEHIDAIDDTIREIRTAVFALETARAVGPSLRREVLDLVARSARVLGLEPGVTFDGPIDALVPTPMADHLLAVLGEALSNVARHAEATQVDVTVRADVDLLLEVTDDGRGIDLDSARGGSGLRNMVHRAQELGGRADVSPGERGGTIVHWVVPFPTVSVGPQ